MSIEVGSRVVPADDPAAWSRAVRLGRVATGRIRNVARALYLAGGIAMGVGVAAHVAGADILLANLVGVATAAILVALAGAPLRDADGRRRSW